MKIIHPTPINRAIAMRVRGRKAPASLDRIGAGRSPLHPDLVSWVGGDPGGTGLAREDRDPATVAPDPGLLDYLAEHLEAGETHYTQGPGLEALRARIGVALAAVGGPDPGPEGVVVTAGEGEALCAVLLSLGMTNGGRVRLLGYGGRHGPLLTMLGVEDVGAEGVGAPAPGTGDVPRAVCLWRTLGDGGRCPPAARDDDIYVGTLDGLPGMPAFRLGFAAGPPGRIRQVMTWKGAWSICSPAPSQRAALYAFELVERRGQARGRDV